MIVGFNLALVFVATKVEVWSYSQFMVGQIQQEYEARNECMTHYLKGVEACLGKLDNWRVKCTPREETTRQMRWLV